MSESAVILSYPEAQKRIRDYVCSRCWGHLTIYDNRGGDFQHSSRVSCPTCGDGYGFVTKAYVEQRQAANRDEYWQARHNLAHVIPGLVSPARPSEVVKSELGFRRENPNVH